MNAAFSPLDYAIFGAYLLFTAGLGAAFVRRQNAAPSGEAKVREYFLAGHSMGAVVVAITVLASLFSGITYLGSAAEVYVHDFSFVLIAFSFFIATPITTLVFLPFFYRARFYTAYQYLGERFGLPTRMLASGMFVLRVLIWLGLAIYAPALALQQVTHLPLWGMILLTGVLTTIYTALGGIRAVIWTDLAQFCVLVGGQLAIVAVALHHIPGGMSGVYALGEAGGKFHLDLRLDPTVRVTLWGLLIGGAFTNLVQLATDQISVQRYLTATDIRAARRSLWLKLALTLPVVGLFYGTGVVLYAFYHGTGIADPLATHRIARADQILPYFVVSELPAGLPALLVAALFSASMSTVSAGLNALTTTTLMDIVRPLRVSRRRREGMGLAPAEEADAESGALPNDLLLAKRLTVGFGAAVVAFAFAVSRAGTSLVEASNALMGLAGGPLLGLFLLGMRTRRTQAVAALAGWAAGVAALVIVTFFTHVSFLWYALIGCAVTVAVGWVVSFLFRAEGGGETGE